MGVQVNGREILTQARIRSDEITKASTGSLTTSEMSGLVINNTGQTDDVTLSLDPVAEGLNFIVALTTTVAKYFRLDPNGSEVIIFDGVALTGGYYVGIASAVEGAQIGFYAVKTGASTYKWYVNTISGPWAAQTA